MSQIEENQFVKKVRKRTIPLGYKPEWNVVYYDEGSQVPKYSYETAPELCDAQITVSEGHPFWSHLKDFKGIKPDVGGDFDTIRWSPIVDKTIYFTSYSDWYHRLWQSEGPFIPSLISAYGTAFDGWGYITKDTNLDALAAKFPPLSDSDNELLAFGTTAIARTRPDVSPASVSQFLVELKRDGIPFAQKLSKDRLTKIVSGFNKKGASKAKHSSKEASDFFLENQFGLQPFVSDLKSFVDVATSGVSTLDNLIANSGKTIRRRYKFPDVNKTTTQGGLSGVSTKGFGQYPYTNEYLFTDTPWGRQPVYNGFFNVETEKKTWFSGAYRIYMPTDMEPVSRLRSAVDHLRWDYGLDVDISTIWNITPWSWLIDWQLNLGDLITNFSKWQDDAVVLQYGYIMQETKSRYIHSAYPGSRFNNPTGDTAPSTRLPDMGILVHRKKRIRATPFGFGLTYGSLSNSQKAILAAIGITRF